MKCGLGLVVAHADEVAAEVEFAVLLLGDDLVGNHAVDQEEKLLTLAVGNPARVEFEGLGFRKKFGPLPRDSGSSSRIRFNFLRH